MPAFKPLLRTLLIGPLLVGLSACKDSDEADPRTGDPLVMIVPAKLTGRAERAFTGVVSARVQSDLGFRVAGKVTERLVDIGQTVRAGQPLMRIDRNDLELAIASRANAVAAAKAVAVQATADENRYRQLVTAGWATKQRYEEAKSAFDSATAQLAAAEAQAQVARNEGGYALLLADADGVVVQTLAEPGQVVAAGQTVVRLAHAGPREASVNLPEAMRPSLGSEAVASLYGEAGSASPARLRQLSDAADPQTRTYEGRYVLGGSAADAPLGATVTIRVPATGLSSAMVEVPIGALYDDGTSPGVWILDARASTVAFRPVKVGRVGDEEVGVREGLAPGESIVALGAQLLHQGQRVRLEAPVTREAAR